MNWVSFKNNALSVRCIGQLVTLWMLCAALAAPTAAQEPDDAVKLTPKLQRAYFEIQKLRLGPARMLIEQERLSDGQNGFIQYLDNYADLHYLLISEDKIAYKKLIDNEDLRLSSLDRLPDSSPYKRFFQAEVRLHWAFAKIKFGNEISGSWDIIKAYRLLEENQRKFPSFLPNLKSLGLLHVLIGSVPDNYLWVTKILGLKGDINLGVQEIQRVILGEPLFQQEAQLIDLLLHAYTLRLDIPRLEKIKQLPLKQPDNLLLHFFATTILMKEGNSPEASNYLDRAPSGHGYIPFPFLSYLKGEIALQQGKYDDARSWYILFDRNYKGFNYRKDCNLKLFMCDWLGNRDAAGASFLDKIDDSGSTIIEADKLAQRFSLDYKSGKISKVRKILYKSRYATDGGYLEEALKMLEPFSEAFFTFNADKAEFNYRKGRILQKSGKTDLALPYFERAVFLTNGTSIEFGATAALQLGYISKERKNKAKAISYFKTALSYKKYEYKNSIDNKAKAALNELGQ